MSDGVDRVLVVDDDEALRTALARSLRRLGYEVEVATNGAEGLRMALANPPPVILTDIRMPELDGHTLLRRLAAHDVDSAIVVMSSHGDMDDVVEVLRHGAVDYLKKPWTASELASAMARATDIHTKRRTLRTALAASVTGATTSASEGATGTAKAEARPDPRAGDAVFAAVLEQLRRGDIVLPSVAPIVGELRVLAHDPRASVDDVAAVIERDPRIAAQVLRLANSAQYARAGRSNDARTAVQRIGMAHIKGIAETIHAHGCYEVRDPALRGLHAQIWKYSVARAISMRALVDLAASGLNLDPETAYVAGLLCDSGATFLIWLAAERAARSGTPVQVDASLRALRQQHAEVGQLLLTRSNMDPAITLVATTHHAQSPPAPPAPNWSISVLAAYLADALVAEGDLTREGPLDQDVVDRCTAELGIGVALLKRMHGQLATELGSILDALP